MKIEIHYQAFGHLVWERGHKKKIFGEIRKSKDFLVARRQAEVTNSAATARVPIVEFLNQATGRRAFTEMDLRVLTSFNEAGYREFGIISVQ